MIESIETDIARYWVDNFYMKNKHGIKDGRKKFSPSSSWIRGWYEGYYDYHNKSLPVLKVSPFVFNFGLASKDIRIILGAAFYGRYRIVPTK